MQESVARQTFVVLSWMGLAAIVLLAVIAAVGGIPWFVVPLTGVTWFAVAAALYALSRYAER